ncbi:MAG TPA: VOC family protein, partial [Acidimicrobiales bacterium]|nr:VOC family protein [Acidimicrobiales bacterium]
MDAVTALGYLRLGAADLGSWRDFATSVIGLQPGDGAASELGDGSLYLKQDDRSYRVAVDRSDDPSVTFGWEVPNRVAMEAVAGRLDALGITVKDGTAEEAEQRLVTRVMLCTDPAGNACEIFYGAKHDNSAFVSPTGARFVTGDMGLGHAFVIVPDGAAFGEFYMDGLGFRVSDYIQLGQREATFLHCNPRHHTLAFVESAGVSALNHF